MEMTIGPEAHAFTIRLDEFHIERSELRASEALKEASGAYIQERTSENEHFEVVEGFLDGAGIAD